MRLRADREDPVIDVSWRWEQDGSGGEHGTALYFAGTEYAVSVQMRTFAEAHELAQAIGRFGRFIHFSGRESLLNEIRRIKP